MIFDFLTNAVSYTVIIAGSLIACISGVVYAINLTVRPDDDAGEDL